MAPTPPAVRPRRHRQRRLALPLSGDSRSTLDPFGEPSGSGKDLDQTLGEWTGDAKRAYVAAHACWDQAARDMHAEIARLQVVSVIAVGALAEHLITSVTIGVVHAPNVRILQAATEGEDFDQVLRDWNDPSSEAPDGEDLESKVRKIAQDLGYTQKEIDEAIHAVKGHSDWRGLGDNRNPDVVVDLRTGEVYPKTKDGVGESSLGNILDHLPERE
jgi:hypothetical protein